jgi:hypothetical protein
MQLQNQIKYLLESIILPSNHRPNHWPIQSRFLTSP